MRQDGFALQTERDRVSEECVPSEDEEIDAEDGCVVVVGNECGVLFGLPEAALRSGQKSGHYADQRDSHRYVADLLRKRAETIDRSIRVLDLY